MRRACRGARLTAFTCVLLAGCSTLEPAAPPAGDPTPQPAPLSQAQVNLSDSLSHYSVGLMHELNREFDEAIDRYLLAARADPDNEALQLEVVRQLLRMQRYDEATALIESYAARVPSSEKARIWQALVYQATQRPEKACEVYEALVKRKTIDHLPYIDLASIHLREGNADRAEAVLQEGARHAEKKVEIYRILGQFYADSLPASRSDPAYRERLNKAIEAYLKASALQPEDITLLYRLGDLHILDQDLGKAVEVFRRIEELRPEDLQIKQRLAYSFLQMGDIDKAIEKLEAFAEDDPSNGAVLYYLGELYQRNGDTEKAKLNFSLACGLIDDDPAPYLRLAILDLDGAPEESVKTLRKGLEKMPREPRLSELLAYSLLAAEEFAPALDQFQAVERARPPEELSGSFRFNHALALYRAGRDDEAGDRLVAAMQENPDFLSRFVNTMLAGKEESLERPLAMVEKLAGAFPEDPMVSMYRALLTNYSGDHAAALPLFQATERLADDDLRKGLLLDDRFYFSYGSALERTGDHEQAVAMFRKAIDINPKNDSALNYVAYMWAERGENLEEALEYVKRALKEDPDSAAYIDTLGWIYFMQGRYPEALKEIERAVTLLPDDAVLMEHLGDVKSKLDREAEAIGHWKRSVEIDPTNEKVQAKLRERGVDPAPIAAKALAAAAAEQTPPAKAPPPPELAPAKDENLPPVALDTGDASELDRPATPPHPEPETLFPPVPTNPPPMQILDTEEPIAEDPIGEKQENKPAEPPEAPAAPVEAEPAAP